MDSVELGLDDKKHFGLDSDTGLMTKVKKETFITQGIILGKLNIFLTMFTLLFYCFIKFTTNFAA